MVISPDGTLLRAFGTLGSKDTEFNHPTVVTESGGLLYILDSGNRRISVFRTDGNFVKSLGSQQAYPSELDEAISSSTEIFGDRAHNQIILIDPKGQRVIHYKDGKPTVQTIQLPSTQSPNPPRYFITDAGALYLMLGKKIYRNEAPSKTWTKVLDLPSEVFRPSLFFVLSDGKTIVVDSGAMALYLFGRELSRESKATDSATTGTNQKERPSAEDGPVERAHKRIEIGDSTAENLNAGKEGIYSSKEGMYFGRGEVDEFRREVYLLDQEGVLWVLRF